MFRLVVQFYDLLLSITIIVEIIISATSAGLGISNNVMVNRYFTANVTLSQHMCIGKVDSTSFK